MRNPKRLTTETIDAMVPMQLSGVAKVLVQALVLARPIVERVPSGMLAWLSRASHPLLAGISRLGTSLGCLEIVARDERRQEIVSVAIEAHDEGLDIPAAPALWAARSLLRAPNMQGGLTRLSQLIAWPEARRWLEQQGYVVKACGTEP